MTPPDLETLWTVEQVAAAFQVTTETVRDWIKDGDLPAYKLGVQWRIKNADLVEFMERKYTKR